MGSDYLCEIKTTGNVGIANICMVQVIFGILTIMNLQKGHIKTVPLHRILGPIGHFYYFLNHNICKLNMLNMQHSMERSNYSELIDFFNHIPHLSCMIDSKSSH